MCGQLDSYLIAFAKLRIDRNKTKWSSLTNYCSPYKPFLLLSILDHIATSRITSNFIEPSFELTETFLGYIRLLPASRPASMSYPFYHLKSATFWQLATRPELQHRGGLTVSSMKRLRELYLGARIASDLFMLMQMEHSRQKLRAVLIQTYFAANIQKALWNQSFINCASDHYSASLLSTSEAIPNYGIELPNTEDKERIRNQGFRKAIVRLYEHRCALCGIKMLTPEGHTIVDAAHIKPWSESHNDLPTNGMALCKLCHWSFDEGLMSVDQSYRVLISPAVKKDPNLPGHILTLSERPMFRPQESRYWPDQENFAWHRKEMFHKKG